ncbi:MAG TPA: signal peptidase II [Bacteroidetes bacterium]|nr:signal peptidase II [Bacteroidota bacterium]
MLQFIHRCFVRYYLLSVFVVLFDQITKILTQNFVTLYDSREVLGNFVRYTYIRNPGMAFGIQIGNKTVFTVFSILASVGIFIYLIKTKGDKKFVRTALSLILGGAIGNLIDRVLYSSVVDFIDVGIGTLRWPVFNVADSAVSIGMVILIAVILFEKKTTEELPEVSQPESAP